MNPIEVIQKVMKMGILGLVLPEGQALSQGKRMYRFLHQNGSCRAGLAWQSVEKN